MSAQSGDRSLLQCVIQSQDGKGAEGEEGEGEIMGWGLGRETHPAGQLGRLGIFKGIFSVECW